MLLLPAAGCKWLWRELRARCSPAVSRADLSVPSVWIVCCLGMPLWHHKYPSVGEPISCTSVVFRGSRAGGSSDDATGISAHSAGSPCSTFRPSRSRPRSRLRGGQGRGLEQGKSIWCVAIQGRLQQRQQPVDLLEPGTGTDSVNPRSQRPCLYDG